MPDLVITPASNLIDSTGGTLVIRTADAQPLVLKTNNTDVLYINSSNNVGIGTTSPAQKFEVNGVSLFDDSLLIKKDVAMAASSSASFGGYSSNPAAGPQSFLELIESLSNAIGVNDPLRFRSVTGPQKFSGGTWSTDASPPTYANLFDGYSNSTVDIITAADYTAGITARRFTVNLGGPYRRPNFITIQSDYGINNFWGYSVFIEKSVDNVTFTTACSTVTVSNNTAPLLAFSLGDLFDNTYIRFTFTATQQPTSGGALRIDRIRSYGNSYYGSSNPVYTNSSGNLFSTTSTFLASSSGNVGIGTTTATQKLDVNTGTLTAGFGAKIGESRIGTWIGGTSYSFFAHQNVADTSGSYSLLQGSDGTTFLNSASSRNLYFRIANVDAMILSSGGNLGIGTTSPAGKLDVRAGSGGEIIFGTYDSNYVVKIQSGDQLNFYNGASATTGYINYNSGATSIGQNLTIEKATAGAAGLVRITSAGNVGIGTTSPSYKLHITGETLIKAGHGTTRLQLYYPNDTAAYEGYLTLWASEPGITYNCTGIGGNINIGGQYYGRATNSSTYGLYLRFNVNDGYSEFYSTTGSAGTGGGQGTRVAYFDSNGTLFSNAGGRFATNVGIGTTSPGYNLEVVSTTGQIANIRSTNAGGYTELLVSSNDRNLYIGQRSSTNSSGDLAYLYTSSSTPITFWNDGAERVRIAASTGNVGIGTTSPVGKLDVYANANAGHIGFIRNASAGSSAYTALVFRRDSDTNGIVLFTNSSTRTADGGAGNSTIRSDNGNLFLGAGGSSQHVLTTNGSLGIGTTAPSYRFDIGAGTGGSVNVRLTPGYERVRFNGVDLLGYPNESLWLISSTTYSSFVLSSANWDWDYQVEMRYTPGTIGVTAGNLILGQINKNNANFTHGITSFYTNGSEKVRINSNGNLGIGTTAPAYKLSVIGNSYFSNSIYISENGFEITARKDDITTRTAGGFFETNNATTATGWPETTNSWYHLLSSTHSNGGNYYSMQLAADFYTQKLFYRSTNSSGTGPWNRVLDATNYSYAANLNQNLRTTDSPTFSSIITGTGTGIYVGNGNISTSSRVIINFHTDADYNYLIGKRAGAWTQPMDIAFYTGIRYHAHRLYNAHIFYTTGYDSTEAFSIGRNNDNHTRVNYDLLVTGSLGIGTTSPSTNLQIGGTAASGGASGALGTFLSRGVTTNFFEAFDGTKSFIAGVDNTQSFAKVGTLTNHPLAIVQSNGSAIYIDTSKNIGIGTTVPKFPLDNYNDSVRSSLRVAEKVIVVNFGNGVANQKVDITFDVAPGTNVLWGNFEVELTSGYSNQLSTGQLIKVFSVGLNPATGTGPYSSAIYDNVSYYKASYGEVASNWAINGISFNTTTGKYYFTVVHRTSTGNVAIIKVKSFVESSSYADNIASLTAGSVYTTDTTTYYKPVIESVAQRIGYNGNVNQSGDLIVQGSVGIGTTSANSKLHVYGASGATGEIRLESSNGRVYTIGSTGTSYGSANNFIIYDVTGGVERIRLQSDGNVGIGTTSASSKLHIKGTTTIENGANSSGTARNAPVTMWTDNAFGMELHNSNSSWQTAIFGRQSDSTVLTFGSYSANETQQQNFNHYLTILNTGNVGIGTESPARKLDVVGDLRFASDNIYLAGATNYIRSDNTYNFLTVAGAAQTAKFAGIQVSSSYTGTIPTDGILFGTDTNIYRSAADTLKTDDNFIANASVGIGGSTATTRVLTITNVSATDRPAIKIVNPNFYSSTSSTGRTFYRWMPIDIDGTTYWIPIYSA